MRIEVEGRYGMRREERREEKDEGQERGKG